MTIQRPPVTIKSKKPYVVPMWKQKVPIILAIAFAVTNFAHGVQTPIGVITPPTMAFIVGLILTFFARLSEGRSLIPGVVLGNPIFIASAVYFVIGIGSGLAAADKALWIKEIVQRTTIIFLPMLLFALTPRKPEEIKFAIMSYLPLCLIVVIFAGNDARNTGLTEASYTFGMHKNQIAGSCSIMSTIAIAGILTSTRKKFKRIMTGFAVAGALGCFASQGKAGMVCIIVATIFMFIAAKTKPRAFLTFGITCVIAGAIMWKVMPDKAREHVVSTKKFSTTEIRMTLWTDVWPVLLAEPFGAVGWGNPLVKNNGGGEDKYYGDCANVLLYDWMQMSLIGPLVLISVIVLAVKQGLNNANKVPLNSLLGFINLVALGVVCGRFTHAMVDTFWIGRGVTLTTWAAIGMLIFVKLYIEQTVKKPSKRGSLRTVPVSAAQTPALR